MEESQIRCYHWHRPPVGRLPVNGSHTSCRWSHVGTPAARVLGAALVLLQLATVLVDSQTTLGQHHSFQVFTNRSAGVQLLEARRRLSAATATTTTTTQASAAGALREPQEARFLPATGAGQVNGSFQGETGASLHFGAKVALAVLSFVIFLVASATLLDHRLPCAPPAHCQACSSGTPPAAQSPERQASMRAQQQPVQQQQQQQLSSQLRDQRSPSLSSSSSCSTLLCSIVSSTTPILSCASCRQAARAATAQPPGNQPAPPPTTPPLPPATTRLHKPHHEPRQQVPWLRLFQLSRKSLRDQWRCCSASGGSKAAALAVHLAAADEKRAPEVGPEEEHWRRKSMGAYESLDQSDRHLKCSSSSGQLLSEQLLLAFSLKRTARHIFHRPARCERGLSRATGKPLLPLSQDQQQQQHRGRVSSLSSISEHQNSASLLHGSREFQDQAKPCIESLHGLRCLSMIWIIVVHSYHFALKSLFAPPGPTNLYKTILSQLLANGSFACDSFFFAAGFLLAYLALPTKQSSTGPATGSGRGGAKGGPFDSQSTVERQQLNMNSQQDCDSISSLSSASDSNSRQSSTKEMQRSHTCAGPPNQNQAHSYHLNNIVIFNSDQFKLTEKSGSAAAPPPPPNPAPATHGANTNPNPNTRSHTNEFTFVTLFGNLLHRYIRMMPLMMAIIGLSATLLRYLGEGPLWEDSTLMYDKWCRKNWWINVLFIHNFLKRENMCLSHSWYAAVDIQLFTLGQLILFVLFRSKKLGLILCTLCLILSQLINGASTLIYHLPAVPLVANFSEQTMNLYYGLIYIKPYCRASPYLIGILLAFLMRRTSLRHTRLMKWQVVLGWTVSLGTLATILLAMRPAMNGSSLSELESALYSSLSRPLWACAIAWMIYACITGRGGPFASILEARCFFPLSQLSYPAFLIHPIVIAIFYGSHQAYSFQFSHYLMLYIIIGNIVITYVSAFLLSALFEFPLLSLERTIKSAYRANRQRVISQ